VVKYTEYLDEIRRRLEAQDALLKKLPKDSDKWLSDERVLYDRHSTAVSNMMANPACECIGRVVDKSTGDGWVSVQLSLDPRPKSPNIPFLLSITAYRNMHSDRDYYHLHSAMIGSRIAVRGVLLPTNIRRVPELNRSLVQAQAFKTEGAQAGDLPVMKIGHNPAGEGAGSGVDRASSKLIAGFSATCKKSR
jgi:hypothetical protein